MHDLLKELKWRGFVHQVTPGCDAHLAKGPTAVYCGFDPTAPSLQLGNLMPLMLLRQFQLHGHRPIVLMGGGTGLIGDPSGKRSERPLLSKEELRANLQRMRDQMARFLDFDPGPASALLLDNAKWLVVEPLVDFLRDIGKHFTVNVMLQKESVQARLKDGISYTEFSYMLLQAYDFLQLFRTQKCTIQVGGSDQWGNITAGCDLIRKVENGEAHALVAPLVTTASGAKFGKTDAGSVWLDPSMTSPYKFYQFWINVDDRDVAPYLRLFTLLDRDRIEEIEGASQRDRSKREAQRALARSVTELVHGDAAQSAVMASEILFGEFDPKQATDAAFDALAAEIPTHTAASRDGLAVVDALVQCGLAKSKSEARRAIEQGGVYLNQARLAGGDRHLEPGDWVAGRNLLLRKGKKDYALLRVAG